MNEPIVIGPKNENISKNIVFISGTARSGTTILGKLIGTLKNIEYEFEPLYLSYLLPFAKIGSIPEKLLFDLLKGFIIENFYNRLIGRYLNLRINDDSSFFNNFDLKDLLARWEKNDNFKQIQNHIANNRTKLVLKCPNFNSIYSLLNKNLPNIKIINIIRYGFDVINSIIKKGWLSNEQLKNEKMIMHRKITKSENYVPWWVPNEYVNKFENWNLETRSMFMWRYLTECSLTEIEKIKINNKKKILNIRFENLVNKPNVELEKISSFLGEHHHSQYKTQMILDQINPNIDYRKNTSMDYNFDKEELKKTQDLLKILGYY